MALNSFPTKSLFFTFVALAVCIPNAIQAAESGEQKKAADAPKADVYPTQQDFLVGKQARTGSITEDPEIMRKTIQALQQGIKGRDEQIAQMAKQLSEQHHKPNLPPLENAQVKVYSLSFAPVQEAAAKIEGLFGTQTLRVAADERTNSLIVYGKPDSLAALDTLMSRVDEQANPGKKGDASVQAGAAAARSLLLRLFWLADGLPQERPEQKAADYLPKSVLQATKQLGLLSPQLVAQTVTSLAIGREDYVDFSTNVPALLSHQPTNLSSEGRLKLAADDRVRLEMGVHVLGQSVNCDLRGSLATPLGHYMVIGTANSILAEGGAPMPMPAGGFGRQPGFAPGAPGGLGGGGPEGGPGPGAFGGPRAPAGPMGPGGAAPGADPQQAAPNFIPTRFAFVIQVIEGESYPAENSKPKSE